MAVLSPLNGATITVGSPAGSAAARVTANAIRVAVEKIAESWVLIGQIILESARSGQREIGPRNWPVGTARDRIIRPQGAVSDLSIGHIVKTGDSSSIYWSYNATLKRWISDGLLMNTTIRTLLLSGLVLALPMMSNAQFTYVTNNGTIAITGYTGDGGAVTVPETIDGFPVTSIERLAFSGTAVTSVILPNTVTNIGPDAFFLCTSMTSIVLPEGLKTIQRSAFYSCFSLESITIPPSVTNIEDLAFWFCYGLTTVYIPGSVKTLNGAFHTCTNLSSVIISNGVTSIGPSEFAYCFALTNVSLPESLTYITAYALSHCPSLTSLTIPAAVTNIGHDAFARCSSLSSISIPGKIRTIEDYVLSDCTNLSSVTISASVTNIGQAAFSGCSNLSNVYFKGNAPKTSVDVFLNCDNATIYYLPGTTGWGPTFAGHPTVLWNPKAQTTDGSFGVRTNRFGFNITGSSDLVIVVEACTNLANQIWMPVATNVLTGGSSYFSDPGWTNSRGRFYRFRSP
jgi:hypothetical protein